MSKKTITSNEPGDLERMVAADHIAQMLHLSSRAVTNHFHAGLLPGYRIGKAIRFRVSEVLAAVGANKTKPQTYLRDND